MYKAKKLLITNALSLNMMGELTHVNIDITRVRASNLARFIQNDEFPIAHNGVESSIGHRELADLVSADLGIDVPYNRANVSLADHDVIVVAQYSGPRLEEGATELPDGARIKYYVVMPNLEDG